MSVTGILAGLGALGSITGIGTQLWTNEQTKKFNAEEAQKQRDFEERMSNTAYTRAMEDIQNAGLNPSMLYASGGSGMASTPQSASASTVTPNNMFMISQVGELLNAINNAKALELKYNKPSITTTKMFNNAGELVKALVKTSKNNY